MNYQLTEANVVAQLRALVPARALRFHEAQRIAELQANRFRALLDLSEPTLPAEAISELPHIRVADEPDLPVSGSAHWSEGRWIIALNAHEPRVRRRFSLAHEFAHILWHPAQAAMYADELTLPSALKAERLADHFAACLLMPKRLVKQLYGDGHQSPEALAVLFDVSLPAMRFRLSQLGMSLTRRCGGTADRIRESSSQLGDQVAA
jgi:predicted transcriptional regulator